MYRSNEHSFGFCKSRHTSCKISFGGDDVNIKGCYFHLTRSVFGNLQQLRIEKKRRKYRKE